MLLNLTIGRYLCFQKYRRKGLDGNLNIYSGESFFLSKGNSAIWCNVVIEMMIQQKLRI